MSRRLDRRSLLKGLGGFAVTSAVAGGALPARADSPLEGSTIREADPNAAQVLAGVHVISDKSVAAGETVRFRISSDQAYRLQVARLGWDITSRDRDWLLHESNPLPAAPREVRPGSYVHVERALPAGAKFSEITLECWVRPKAAGRWHGLITQYDYARHCGVGLFLDDQLRPVAYFGDGGSFRSAWLVTSARKIAPDAWAHVVATFDGRRTRLYLDGQLTAESTTFSRTLQAGRAPLRLGAYGEGGVTTRFLAGDLAMPTIHGRALAKLEIHQRTHMDPIRPPKTSDVVGCWPLDEESGHDVRDVSPVRRDGTIVNRGTWMIGGPRYAAATVPRFDPAYDPDTDPSRGHALRLSPDDLYAVDWPETTRITIPDTWASGLYVARIARSTGDDYHATFVVRPAPNRPSARVLVLANTNTWHAYNHAPFESHSSAARYSFYERHDSSGVPAYQLGLDLPWPSADPYLEYPTGSGYGHLVRAERALHVWLEQGGYDYDMIGDADLHADPTWLADYPVVFVTGHSEYWSREAYEALVAYIDAGGQVIVASGNTMFWRVTLEDDVIECRKLPMSVNNYQPVPVGEVYHTHDHRRGGLMREAGHPAWQAIGIECIGFGGTPVAYEVQDPGHPFFCEPELVPVAPGDELGGRSVVGHEYDVSLARIPGAPSVVMTSPPHVLAHGVANVRRLNYEAGWVAQTGRDEVISEIVDWSRLGGGRVLAAGSIAAANGLHADPNLASMFRNALDQMGVGFRLNVLAVDAGGVLLGHWHDGRDWGPGGAGWRSMGAGFDPSSSAAGVMYAPDRLGVVAIRPNGEAAYRHWNGSTWSGWSNLGGDFVGRPAMVAWGRSRLEIFCRHRDGRLLQKTWTGFSWTGWQDLGGELASDPAAIVWERGRLAVAALDRSGRLVYKWWQSGIGWQPGPQDWIDFGGTFAQAPTLVAWGGNQIDLFAVDATGRARVDRWDGNAWSGWIDLGGDLGSPIAVAVREGEAMSIFARDRSGQLVAKWWDGSAWGPAPLAWQSLGGDLVGTPSVAAWRGRQVEVVATARTGRVQHLGWDGVRWSAWRTLATGTVASSPTIFSWVSSVGRGAV
ncbi:MAG: LamG domain-containing protein [bacterium]|nr:LamG domain-containing protein [bacterium]